MDRSPQGRGGGVRPGSQEAPGGGRALTGAEVSLPPALLPWLGATRWCQEAWKACGRLSSEEQTTARPCSWPRSAWLLLPRPHTVHRVTSSLGPAVFRSKDFVTQACWLAAFTSVLGSHEGCPVTLQGQCVLPPSLAAAQPRAAPWGRPCHHLEPWNPVLLRQRPDPPPRGPEDGTLTAPGPERSGLQSGVDPSCHFPL